MRSKAESPPLGPIRTLALYREGVAGGRKRGVGGWQRGRGMGRRRGTGGGDGGQKLLSYDIHNLCRGAFPVQVFSP